MNKNIKSMDKKYSIHGMDTSLSSSRSHHSNPIGNSRECCGKRQTEGEKTTTPFFKRGVRNFPNFLGVKVVRLIAENPKQVGQPFFVEPIHQISITFQCIRFEACPTVLSNQNTPVFLLPAVSVHKLLEYQHHVPVPSSLPLAMAKQKSHVACDVS